MAAEVLRPLHEAEALSNNMALENFVDSQVWGGSAYRLLWRELMSGRAWVRPALESPRVQCKYSMLMLEVRMRAWRAVKKAQIPQPIPSRIQILEGPFKS